MQLTSTPLDLPNLVISTSSQTTTHQLHMPFSSYWIHIMALHTSNFLKVLLHACYHPHLPVSFLCFAVKAGHWFPPDSKDHTHRLGVPAFSKKSSKVNIYMGFAAPKPLLVLSSFQRIALHRFNLFESEKDMEHVSKALGVEYPPTCSPTVYNISPPGWGSLPWRVCHFESHRWVVWNIRSRLTQVMDGRNERKWIDATHWETT